LEGLRNVIYLYLGLNNIRDIQPLAELTDVEELSLENNQYVSDISPLKSLKNLRYLVLAGNQISDISPLTALEYLGYLDLRDNPLTQEACSDIQQIKENNEDLNVDYDASLDCTLDPGEGPEALPPFPPLVGHWKFDEPGGSTASDSSGYNHNGTLYGSPVWIPDGGVLGGALMFDGVDDYVHIPHSEDLNPESITVAAWINPDRVDSPMDFVYTLFGYRLYIDAGRVVSQVSPSSPEATNPIWRFASISAGEWSHAAVSWDAPSGEWATYLNGVDNGVIEKGPDNPLRVNQRPLFIGAQAWRLNDSRNHFDGLIDDVRIYNMALNSEQIVAVMEGTVAPEPLGSIVSHWPADGTPADVIGQNDGRLMHGTAFSPGVIDQAFAFDGVDDYVRIACAPDLGPPSVTAEAWIKPNRIGQWMDILYFWGSYRLYINTNGRVHAQLHTSLPTSRGTAPVMSFASISAGQWSHIAFTWDAPSGKWTGYLNGSETVSRDEENNNPLLPVTAVSAIGAQYNDYHFDGLIDEVVIYDRALTPEEIMARCVGD
jgi:hypothetical protein